MDTPERTQISTPLSKFEDSPVFNYINSLSPIKPVKSIHITQTFNPLSFASLPSVFTSPHVSAHKESRFIKRHNYSDLSKSGVSSQDGHKVGANERATVGEGQLCDSSGELQESFDPGVCIEEPSLELQNEHSRFAIELPHTLKYDCGSPDCEPTPVTETNSVSELAVVPTGQNSSGKDLTEGICQTEQKKESSGCDWESLISDAADILIFSSPNDSEAFKGLIQKTLEPGSSFYTSHMSRYPQDDLNELSNPGLRNRDPSLQIAEISELNEIKQTQGIIERSNLNECMAGSPIDGVDNEPCDPFSCKPISHLHCGMRRRCLDFETLTTRGKNLDDDSNGSSSRCIVPGIGLHLNALAITSRDSKNIKHETLTFGRQKISIPSSSVSILATPIDEETIHEPLASGSSERGADPAENAIQLVEDASQASALLPNEEFNQNSPKKKRRRLEHAGEGEACKRCNCKKSKCLKLYCECFAAGVYCIEPCSCQDCFNKPIHEDTVLATRKQIESRNPLAFAPKVIRSSDSTPEIGDESSKTPASARHKRGCNCKKSSCLKKYCECYQGGVGCSVNCRCEGCKNAFGRKDGSITGEVDGEPDELETREKSGIDTALLKDELLNDDDQLPASGLPATPLQLCRALVQLPFSSKSKPPRSLLGIGSSSGLYNSQRCGKPNIIRPQTKFDKHFQPTPDDEMPEILRGISTPTTGIKTSSPNSKRVSPPHCELGTSPGRKSGRKLILQSIPSFPSLTSHQ